MEDKKVMKNMEYWRKKNNIPGIEALENAGLTDGRAKSSAFQMADGSPLKGFWGSLGNIATGGLLGAMKKGRKGDWKGAAGSMFSGGLWGGGKGKSGAGGVGAAAGGVTGAAGAAGAAGGGGDIEAKVAEKVDEKVDEKVEAAVSGGDGSAVAMKKSPVKKKGGPETKQVDVDDLVKADKNKQVPLSEHEDKKGTMITGGSESEVMNDLEDRIEFLTSDIKDGNTDPKLKAQLKKLKMELARLESKSPSKIYSKNKKDRTKYIK